MFGHQGRGLRTAVALLVVAVALLAPPAVSRLGATPSPENPAKLIYAGWFGNTTPTPSFIAANLAFLDSRPFDGIVVYMRNPSMTVNMSSSVMKPTVISYDTMMSVLSPIANASFTNLTDNLGVVYGSTPPDFFDDWSNVVQNYSNLAKALKDSGLKGVCFDNEQYSSPWGDYGTHNKYYSSKTFAQYQAQAHLRGKQIMEAMVAQFPNIVFLTLHGPYISEPKAPTALEFPQWQVANELMGPFFAGNLEGAGTTATVIDGGELYSLRSQSSFDNSATWRRQTITTDSINCSFIPTALRPVWPERVSISFGVYDKPFWGNTMDATVARPTLANAMRAADKYVWFYTEAYTHLLPPGSGGAPQAWVDAIAGAQADVAASIPPPSSPPAPAPPTINAPSNLSASVVSPFEIDLSWTDNSANETGFQVERRLAVNGTWALVATTAADATYLRNGGLWSGTGYHYRVRAVNGSDASAFSAEASATTGLVGDFLPAAPSNLTAAAASTTAIDLSWQDNSSTENGFQVERRAASGTTWSLVGTCEAGSTTHRDEPLVPSTAYVYRVRSVNIAGESAYTAEATAATQGLGTAPAAPSGLTAVAVSPFAVDLAWSDNSSDETGFQIERRTVINGTWSQVATTQGDVTSLHNGGLWSATGYVYRVRAFNAFGASAFSGEVTATTPFVTTTPAAPTGLSATPTSNTEVTLAWTDNSWNESGFRIYRRRSGGTWTLVATAGANATTHLDAGRTRGITYVYRIRAYNTKGNSSYSPDARVTMP